MHKWKEKKKSGSNLRREQFEPQSGCEFGYIKIYLEK